MWILVMILVIWGVCAMSGGHRGDRMPHNEKCSKCGCNTGYDTFSDSQHLIYKCAKCGYLNYVG